MGIQGPAIGIPVHGSSWYERDWTEKQKTESTQK